MEPSSQRAELASPQRTSQFDEAVELAAATAAAVAAETAAPQIAAIGDVDRALEVHSPAVCVAEGAADALDAAVEKSESAQLTAPAADAAQPEMSEEDEDTPVCKLATPGKSAGETVEQPPTAAADETEAAPETQPAAQPVSDVNAVGATNAKADAKAAGGWVWAHKCKTCQAPMVKIESDPFEVSSQVLYCDGGCHLPFKSGETRWSCATCDFDLCDVCAGPSARGTRCVALAERATPSRRAPRLPRAARVQSTRCATWPSSARARAARSHRKRPVPVPSPSPAGHSSVASGKATAVRTTASSAARAAIESLACLAPACRRGDASPRVFGCERGRVCVLVQSGTQRASKHSRRVASPAK
jgi:hypothetical protein